MKTAEKQNTFTVLAHNILWIVEYDDNRVQVEAHNIEQAPVTKFVYDRKTKGSKPSFQELFDHIDSYVNNNQQGE